MADIERTVAAVAGAPSWDARVALIRRVPEDFGTAQHKEVYAAIAKRVYVPNLAPDFAYFHWRAEYELEPLQRSYAAAEALTAQFTDVTAASLEKAVATDPTTLRIFRLLLGLTSQEFAAASRIVAERLGLSPVSTGRIRAIESGAAAGARDARCCARVIDEAMIGKLFEAPAGELRSKIDKPDTAEGWETVRRYARSGVPLPVFLHQRHYGGAFRQVLDATSTKRGDIIEDAVVQLFTNHAIPYVRTGSRNQEEVERRFGVTIKPAPDFVVFDATDNLRAMLECKGANDGGTARDKAARFRSLRAEAGVSAACHYSLSSPAWDGRVRRTPSGLWCAIPTAGLLRSLPSATCSLSSPFPD